MALAVLDDSLTFWRKLGDSRGLAVALFFRGLALGWIGRNVGAAVPFFLESLMLSRQRGPHWTTYFSLRCLGEAARLEGNHDHAESLLRESLALSQAAGDRWGGAYALHSLGLLWLMRGEVHRARSLFREALEQSQELGATLGLSFALDGLGCVASAMDSAERATRLFGAAEAQLEPIGALLCASFSADYERGMNNARVQIGAAAFAAHWAAGRAMPLPAVVKYARSDDVPLDANHSLPTPFVTPLTARERQVAMMVARGLTNRQIAEELVIAMATATLHVEHIRGKLGFHSRAEIAGWAVRTGYA